MNVEVHDAEVYGALAALETITTSKRDRGHNTIYLLLGNSSAVQVLLTGTMG